MKKFIFTLSLYFFSTYGAQASLSLIEIDGTINPGNASFIQDAIQKASETKKQALIIRMNTPGGLLSSTRSIIQSFSTSPIPIIMYISPSGASATSAGAILMISSHINAMAPGTNIGAAHPVATGGKNIEGDLGKKATNDTAALVRAQAKLHLRNVKIAEEIVTKSISLTAIEAKKQKIVDYIAKDINELLQKLDGKEIKKKNGSIFLQTKQLTIKDLEKIEMNGSQKFLHLIADPNISTLLMTLGGLGIYAEISSGFSLIFPGFFGVIALILALVSLQTLPINVGGVILFFLGIVLIIAEGFVTSFGALTIGGLAAITIGALFLIDVHSADLQVSISLLLSLLGSIGLVAAFIAYSFAKEKRGDKIANELVGKEATVISISKEGDSGRVSIFGETWNFITTEKLVINEVVIVTKQKGLELNIKKKIRKEK